MCVSLAAFKNTFHNRQCGKYIGPASVKGQMSEDFRGLLFFQAVVHGPVQMVGDLGDLPGGDQRAHSNKTSISRRESRTKPEVAEQYIGRVLDEARRDGAEVLLYGGRTF